MIPIAPAVVFAIVASPETYKITSSLLGNWVASSDGAAKIGGLLLHAIVFTFLLSFVLSFAVVAPKKSGFGQRPGDILSDY